MQDVTQTERIFEAARQAQTKRSPLFAWLVRHHDDFAARLDRESLTWDQLAAGFNENGLHAAGGHPVTAAIAWKTWQRAQQHVAKKRNAKTAKPKPAQPEQGQSALFGARPQQTVTLYDEEPPPRPISRKGF